MIKRYVNANKMIKDINAMSRFAEAITCEGIIKYLNDNIVFGKLVLNRREKIVYCCPYCGAEMGGDEE